MTIKKGYKALVAAAEAEIETISMAQALALHGADDVLFIDLRDVRELWHDGKIAGAKHVPRGMLEFWIDPESPYHKPIFSGDQKLIFYCNLGWRSALAAQVAQQMGLSNVCHIAGGFDGWVKAGGPVEEVVKR